MGSVAQCHRGAEQAAQAAPVFSHSQLPAVGPPVSKAGWSSPSPNMSLLPVRVPHMVKNA